MWDKVKTTISINDFWICPHDNNELNTDMWCTGHDFEHIRSGLPADPF